jgi:7-cyano-7-deazaguanine synthase
MCDTKTSGKGKKAVVLLSGGLDSFTAAAIAKQQGFICHGLTIDYGQRHRIELDCAKNVASYLKLKIHRVADLDMTWIGGSALTDEIAVPKHSTQNNNEIPATYVPARNTIFLSLALGWAEALGAFDIFIGANAVDYSGYPDCRPNFLDSFEKMANLATKAAVTDVGKFTLHAPLVDLSKDDIIRKGIDLDIDYAITHSCYDPSPNNKACGLCDSCQLRLKGFADAGLNDPVEYIDQ